MSDTMPIEDYLAQGGVLSSPAKDKWRKRYDELLPALPSMVELSERLGYPTDW